MATDEQFEALRAEVGHLVDYIQKIKEELASVKHPKSKVDHFLKVSDQLESIVGTTETATETIMGSAENILTAVDSLSQNILYSEAQDNCNTINDNINIIFESCSFHDLTGQRISKIVRIMNSIEDALDSLVGIVGKSSLEALPVEENEDEDIDGRKDDGVPLHGPQNEGEGISQADIDKLFG